MESIHVASRILKSFDIYLYSSSLLSFFFFSRILTSFTSILILPALEDFHKISSKFPPDIGEKNFFYLTREIFVNFSIQAPRVIPRICARKMRRARRFPLTKLDYFFVDARRLASPYAQIVHASLSQFGHLGIPLATCQR